MRLAQIHLRVCGVEHLRTECAQVDGIANRRRLERLTAAVYTAARAGHDFDEIDLFLAVLNLCEQLLRVLRAARDRNLDFEVAELVGGALDRSGSANVVEFELFERLAKNNLGGGAQSGFHNAAGRAEDRARAGTDIERLVEFLVLEGAEVDSGFFNHACKLARRDCDIDVRNTGCRLTVTSDLELLRGAGDAGYEEDVLRVKTHLFGVISLIHSAEHLLGRLAARQILGHIREVVLAVLDPSGRAGGDERELAALLDSFEELGSLLHDCEVGGEVHVVYAVEAETLYSRDHLALDVGARLVAEALADSGAD